MMKLADKWVHPTIFTGEWPDWNGYTWLNWSKEANCPHPGDDYNFRWGDQDLGQDVVISANGKVFHTSESNKNYGNLIIVKHRLGYNLKRFIKETYGIETDHLYTLYAHLKDILVKVGDEVTIGQVIAHVGKSGTKWAHLHFEIYSLWKDLKNVTYRFYPVGWSKERIKENWLPAYKFIEATKNIESYETFLGKSKDYWIQVEKDREGLLEEIGKKDDSFLEILVPLEKKIKDLEKENRQKKIKIAKHTKEVEKTAGSHKKEVEKLESKIKIHKTKIKNLQIRITEILEEQSIKLQVGEIVIMFVEKLKKKIKGGE